MQQQQHDEQGSTKTNTTSDISITPLYAVGSLHGEPSQNKLVSKKAQDASIALSLRAAPCALLCKQATYACKPKKNTKHRLMVFKSRQSPPTKNYPSITGSRVE